MHCMNYSMPIWLPRPVRDAWASAACMRSIGSRLTRVMESWTCSLKRLHQDIHGIRKHCQENARGSQKKVGRNEQHTCKKSRDTVSVPNRYSFCTGKTITNTVSVPTSTLKDTVSVPMRLSTDTVSVHLLCLPRGRAFDLLLGVLIFQLENQRVVP